MSKKLIKILAVCGIIVIISLIILGSIFWNKSSTTCTLNVYADGIEGGVGATSKVSILIDNVKQESNQISIEKNTKVTVTYEGDGYDFIGWYDGNYDEIDLSNSTPLSSEMTYSFIVEENSTLTAIRNIKTYTITYAGKMYDGTNVAIEKPTRVYNFGDALIDMQSSPEAAFTGWYISNSTDSLTYQKATFPNSGEYTLYPGWSDQMIISYKSDKFDNSYTIGQDRITIKSFENYSLPNSNDSRVINYLKQYKLGYSFAGWVDSNDLPITEIKNFTPNQEIVIYIKTELETYNINVKYNDVTNTINKLTFDVENGFSIYEPKDTRQGYKFIGLKYKDLTYVYNSEKNDYISNGISLKNIILNDKSYDITVTAVWNCIYPINIDFYVDAYTMFENMGKNVYGKQIVNGEEQYININYFDDENYMFKHSVIFEDKIGEDYHDVNENIIKLALSNYNFEGFYRKNEDGSYTEVEFTGTFDVKINDIGNEHNFSVGNDGTISFNQLFTMLASDKVDINKIERLYFTFEFVEK